MAQMVLSPAACFRPAMKGPVIQHGRPVQRTRVLYSVKYTGLRGISSSVGRTRAVEQYADGTMTQSGIVPSPVNEIHSLEGFQKLVQENEDRLIILKCKAKGCRPCKAFAAKYLRFATEYPDVTFAEITGDESMDTRAMMMKMKVKSTPTFLMYTNGEQVHKLSGANKEKLTAAILDHIPGQYDSPVTEAQVLEGGLQMKLQGA